MAVSTPAGGHQTGFGSNTRTDNWWAGPLATLLGLSAFGVYATWAAFQGVNYYAEPYLSPFYSPLIFIKEGVAGGAPLAHAWIGTWPAWWPSFLPASPAFFILAFPGSFRFTCYYYRKAYYRAFTGTPPACAATLTAGTAVCFSAASAVVVQPSESTYRSNRLWKLAAAGVGIFYRSK